MYIERELKLHLPAAAVQRVSRLARSRRSLASIYFDTPERTLARAGASLRLRRDRRHWLQTLKMDSGAQAAFATRAEWETPVNRKALELARFPRGEIKAATGLDIARLARRVRPVFETRFTRRSRLVELEASSRAELAVDRGALIAGGRREPISEIELELKSGAPRALLRFAEELGLPLAFESKAARGYRLAAGEQAAPRKWRAPEIARDASAQEAFAALFSAALEQTGSNAHGMLLSNDAEFLHQMRVGLRRLRSTLRAFDAVVEAPKPLLRRLRRLMPTLGRARDWDVFSELLQAVSREQALLARARRKRAVAQRAARAAVSSAEFNLFMLRALRWLHGKRRRGGREPLVACAAAVLDRLYRKLPKSIARDNAKKRHKLRIRVKHLRYACEFFAPCFPDAGRFLPRLEALQHILGELNDLAVGQKLLAEIGGSERVAAKLAARAAALNARLVPAWEGFAAQARFWRARK